MQNKPALPKKEAVFKEDTLQDKAQVQHFADQVINSFVGMDQTDRQISTDLNKLSANSPAEMKEFVSKVLQVTPQEADESSKLAPETLDSLLRDTAVMVKGLAPDYTVEGILSKYHIGGDPWVEFNKSNKQMEHGMSKGGLVKDQMEFMFMNEGGMVDSGKSIEPTSGNPIPPGSLPKEVKDDVPARLSEGEYVMPADVVQFYGLDKIEKMVSKAKEGLGDMEARGRIGGQPVPAPQTEDDLLFDTSELQFVEEMSEGGFINSGGNSLFPNYGGAPLFQGYGAGPTTSGSQAYETRIYENAQGDRISIQFINGQPVGNIPEGYVPLGQAPKQAQARSTSVQSANPSAERDFKTVRESMSEEDKNRLEDMTQWGYEDFERAANMENTVKEISTLGLLGGLPGMAVGLGMQGLARLQSRDAASEVKRRIEAGLIDEAELPQWQQLYQDLNERDSDDSSGGGILQEGLLGQVGKLFGGGQKSDTPTPTPQAAAPRSPAPTPRRVNSSNERDSKPTRGDIAVRNSGINQTVTPSQTPRTTRSIKASNTTSNQNQTQAEDAMGRSNNSGDTSKTSKASSAPPTSRFNEGGLVKKRKKKSK